jgi:hypothetical protein
VRQMAAVKQSGKIVSDDRIPLCGKNCTRWNSSTLAECLRRPNSAVAVEFQQWRQWFEGIGQVPGCPAQL